MNPRTEKKYALDELWVCVVGTLMPTSTKKEPKKQVRVHYKYKALWSYA